MILYLDTENTTYSKGDSFDQRNSNVCISWAVDSGKAVCDFGVSPQFTEAFSRSPVLVGFNLKYDLHWLKKLGFNFDGKRVYCAQLGEYLLTRQQTRYPSLNECAEKYLGTRKLDVVATEYWDKGINTDGIPRDILAKYAIKDVEITRGVSIAQQKLIPDYQSKLFSIHMQDLLVLQEMEWNGLYFDEDRALQKATTVENQIAEIQTQLSIHHNVPSFNWSSNDHVSALLYGGTIAIKERIPDGHYKTGAKKGEIKFKVVVKEYHLPRRYTPSKKSALQKDGYYSVGEEFLQKLKGDRALPDGIMELKKLQKKIDTYLIGFPKRRVEHHWPKNILHTKFNQCVTGTGRLSSSDPNIQNLDGEVLDLFESKYG